MSESKEDKIFNYCNYTVLALLTFSVLYPLIFIISASFSSTDAVAAGRVWLWPVDLSLEGYQTAFDYGLIWTGYANSLYYTVLGTAINVVLTIMAAYPLSRQDFRFWKLFMFLFVFTMMFSGGLIPTYLLVRDLGLLDTRWAMILPNAMGVFNVIIARTFFKSTIPNELRESAQIDGCNDFRFLRSIVLPLSGPIIAVISLFYAVGHWNAYFNALVYLRNQELFPLQLVLRSLLEQNQFNPAEVSSFDAEAHQNLLGLQQLLKYTLIVLASAPLLAIYPFVQKYFVKGVMLGSLKE